MIVCAGNGESFAFAKSIGVGLVESGIGLIQLCLRENVDSILFVGSAGAYDRQIKLFDMYISDSATNIELSFLQGQSYTPLDNRIDSGLLEGKPENVLCETMGLKRAVVNSSNYITTDEVLAQKLNRAGIYLENMEFFALMRVAQYFQIPCLGLFCVSNYCNENAHKDFLANRLRVREILNSYCEMLKRIESYVARERF